MSWTIESLTLASALMKLAEGREVSEEPREAIGCACWAGLRSPDDRLPNWWADDGRPSLPPPAKGRTH